VKNNVKKEKNRTINSQHTHICANGTSIGNSNDGMRKNETRGSIACTHPGESKGRGENKSKIQKKQVVIGSI